MLVDSGKVDALALSAPTLRWMVASKQVHQAEWVEPTSIVSREDGLKTGYIAFAFRKEDTALRAAWDQQLKRFLGSEEHLRLVRPFGVRREDLPAGVNDSNSSKSP
jgi:polar amino acid transport system substrate-binding protein